MKGHVSEESIALLAGDDLDPKLKAGVKQHIAGCDSCAAMLREYQQARKGLAGLYADRLEASDYAAVRQSVLERIEVAETKAAFPWFRWAAAGLAVVLLCIVLLPLWMRTRAPVQVAERPAPAATASVTRPAPERSGTAMPQSRPRPKAARRQPRPAPPVQVAQVPIPALDDIAVKLETEDSNVIIIWLSSYKGERR